MNHDKEAVEAAEKHYVVFTSGDGSYESDVVFGREAARRKFAEHMWHGPYEEACQDEMVSALLKEFDDEENHWSMGIWKWDGEQCGGFVAEITGGVAYAREKQGDYPGNAEKLDNVNKDIDWEKLSTEEKLGRNVIYFMKKWADAQKEASTLRQQLHTFKSFDETNSKDWKDFREYAEKLKQEIAKLKAERERIREKLKLVRQSLIHSECWAPGPTTGNYYEDFIVCPGCKGIAILDELLGEK